ncbi:MAG TPA: anti-sigma factor [Anaerolineales bacterium]|nr:anti-sigma factor [Anaerolineales bacterium]
MDNHIEDLLPFYALDALTEEERELVETYLAKHPEARAQLDEMNRAVVAVPQDVVPVEPSPRTKQALMQRVSADAQARSRSLAKSQPSRESRFASFFRTFSLAAAALALIWVLVLNLQVVRMRNEIASLNNALAAQSDSLNQIIQKLPQNNPSGTITVSLKGTKAEPQAQGQLIANPSSQSAVLVVTGLPPLEPGKTYQVWLIANAPVSAGLLTVDANGQGVLIITSTESIGSFKSLGISVEPAGGSPQPTGDIVVLSDL